MGSQVVDSPPSSTCNVDYFLLLHCYGEIWPALSYLHL